MKEYIYLNSSMLCRLISSFGRAHCSRDRFAIAVVFSGHLSDLVIWKTHWSRIDVAGSGIEPAIRSRFPRSSLELQQKPDARVVSSGTEFTWQQ